MKQEDVYELVLLTTINFARENNLELDVSKGRKTRIYGGTFDSMALVALIVQLEEALEDTYGKTILIADEKAMSRRTSPFLSVGLLSDYVFELLNTSDEF
jgi:acyl carrier protein